MKKKSLTLIVFLIAHWSLASPIASESFSSPEGYQSGEPIGSPATAWNIVGTTGFSGAFLWKGVTQTVIVQGGEGLDHELLEGEAQPGFALIRAASTDPTLVWRSSYRDLGELVEEDLFYLSGLVSTVNGQADFRPGDQLSMGLSNELSYSNQLTFRSEQQPYRSGVFLGLAADETGIVRLAAFASGEVWPIGDPIGFEESTGTHLIVLRVELGSGSESDDTLTAWYALDGEDSLTQAWRRSGLDIATSSADLSSFGLQSIPTVEGYRRPSEGAAFDEFRFGTEPGSVVRMK